MFLLHASLAMSRLAVLTDENKQGRPILRIKKLYCAEVAKVVSACQYLTFRIK